MNTHDEDTRQFFKHSSVKVLLCPRAGGKGHSFLKTQVLEILKDLTIFIFLVYAFFVHLLYGKLKCSEVYTYLFHVTFLVYCNCI